MSSHVHRARRSSRGRRWRSTSAVAAAAALTLATAGIALADVVAVDGDTVKTAGANIQYSGTSTTNPANHACTERGNPVSGSTVITYDNSGTNPKHFAAGEALSVAFTGGTTGITVTRTTPVDGNNALVTPHIPATWDTNGQTYSIGLSTTVAASVPVGTYTVTVTVTGQTSGVVRDDTFDVTVDLTCPISSSNTAPSVAFTSSATTSDEGSAASYTFAITDPDTSQTWDFATGYPICGTDGTSSNTDIDNATQTGSFDCTFPDGPASRTVSLKVTDSAGADSNVDTIGATVDNVAPTVAQPAFTTTANIDCRNSVTLGGISFSDPGVNDANWTVDIDWGDGSTHTSITRTTQGSVPDQTHQYDVPGGPYTPRVTVTDKDNGSDYSDSSNSITVLQTYTTDFLAPFDDSSPSGLIVNKMKNGRVVPVKATIYDDCTQSYVTDPATAVTIATSKTSGTGTGDPVETYADAGSSSAGTNLFRWNADATVAGGGFWIYNLDSKALGLVVGNNYRVDAYVDGSAATGTKATVDDWAVLQPVK